MSDFFADISTVLKFYVSEHGRTWVRSWMHPQSGNNVVISRLVTVEFVSAISRREREKHVSPTDVMNFKRLFTQHTHKFYRIANLNVDVMTTASPLVTQHSLRTLDAIQLACALKASQTLNIAITFVSADTAYSLRHLSKGWQ